MARAVLRLCVAAISLFALCARGGTEFWADPVRGDDGNDGRSADRAFRTLNAATANLKAGDVLHLAPGAKFRESLKIRASGEPTNPIAVKGNGAVISGLEPVPDDSWEDKGEGLWLSTNGMAWGACRPRVLLPSGEMVSVPISDAAFRRPELLKPGCAAWRKEGIWFRPEAGRKPSDYALRGFYRVSGVEIVGRHYIEIENLTAEHFSNDGFNVHGSCRGLVFRNITASGNGDDGFSVHEDVMASVYGLNSFGNDNGIADVSISQSMFCGAVVESNRLCGVDFHGGIHIMRDSTVKDNGMVQILARGRKGDDPMATARVFLEGVKVSGSEGVALKVREHSEVSARNCMFSGCEIGLDLEGGRTHLAGSTIDSSGTSVRRTGESVFTQAGPAR